MIRKGTALTLLVALAGLCGCGGASKVEGVVTLDGTPVDGATVTFVPADDKGIPANGQTDSSGKFTLSTGGKPGARRGDYKVTVVKVAPLSGNPETMKPGSPDYEKAMKDKGKDKSKAPPGMGMIGGKMPMPGGRPGDGIKSDLPHVYATPATTPLTAKIPSSGPVKLELTAKK
jgi:hypothetical protein